MRFPAPRRVLPALVFLAAECVFAQGYLSGIALNKKIVTDFYRVVFEPRNSDLIEQYVAPDFVEHNPNIQGGREGLVKFLKSLPPPASDDVGPDMKSPPALVIAEGDLVTFIFKTSDRFTFDTFRVKNGKIVEHWDGAARNQPPRP